MKELHYIIFLLCFILVSCSAQAKEGSTNESSNQPFNLILDLEKISMNDFDPYFIETNSITSPTGPDCITRNILQDRNGDVWLASWEGIIRYDGNSFTNFTNKNKLRRFHVFSLLEDTKGNLWFGTIGAGAYKYDGDTFTNITVQDGLANDTVGCMFEDTSGNIWFGTAGGASMYDGNSFHNFTDADGLSNNDINSIIEDVSGNLWFGTRGNVSIYDGDSFTNFTKEDNSSFTNVRSIIEDKNGYIWLGGNDGLWRFDGTSFVQYTSDFVGYIYEDSAGYFWVSAAEPNPYHWVLWRYDASAVPLSATKIKKQSGQLYGIFEDTNGDIWVGNERGVFRYDGKADFENFQAAVDIVSDGTSDDYFGRSVSISSDGSTAIVGARYDDDNGSQSGSAYIYKLVEGIWQETKLLASDGADGDYFGQSVSISSDGSTAIVGAYGDDDNGTLSGSAYIYKLVGGVLQETKLLASNGASKDYFGYSVSISSDGATAIVGAVWDDDNGTNSGSAYIYKLDGGVWQETKLLASDGASSDQFGASISISKDGGTAIVGAYGDDDNGTYSGSAYIYKLVGDVWQETKLLASDMAKYDQFATCISISSNGTTALVGADGDDDNGSCSGSAYIYSLVKGIWQETKLLASDGTSSDYFGYSVSISSDGTTAIVGARYDDDNGSSSGSAYIYSLVKGIWQETKLLASDGASDDWFGFSVSISSDGSTAIVGAYGDDDNGSESGSACIYHFDGSSWIETKIVASDGGMKTTSEAASQ